MYRPVLLYLESFSRFSMVFLKIKITDTNLRYIGLIFGLPWLQEKQNTTNISLLRSVFLIAINSVYTLNYPRAADIQLSYF